MARRQTIAIGEELYSIVAGSQGRVHIPIDMYTRNLVARILNALTGSRRH